MKKLMLLFSVVFIVSSCTDKDGARELLKKEGYTNIKLGGHCWFSCGEGDDVSTAFSATNRDGHYVEGCVCDGFLFKNKTIRFK